MKVLYKTIATGFGSGYTPVAPGTAGAALGCLLLGGYQYFIGHTATITFQISFLILITLTTVIGAIATYQLEPEWGEDPSKVVIDEIIGVWIALLFVPLSWQNILIGFVLFRLFDIYKPLGIRKLEAIPKGWGVMLDDVLAGIYANLVLQIYLYIG